MPWWYAPTGASCVRLNASPTFTRTANGYKLPFTEALVYRFVQVCAARLLMYLSC